MSKSRALLLVAVVCAGAGCRDAAHTASSAAIATAPESGARQLTDVAAAAGITFRHSFGDTKFSNLAEAVGSGAAWLDYDGDGRLDVYAASGKYAPVVSEGPRPSTPARNRLYRNRGAGIFEDVTEAAGVALEGRFNTGVAAADYDNDGDTDLYVCGFARNTLMRNDRGRFVDVTAAAGVGNDGRFGVAATWLDYDRDSFPDLYVANYIELDPAYKVYYAPDGFPGPLAYKGQPHRLYRNRGDGTFEDASERAGIARHVGRGMGVVALDYDDDADDDIYVTNDAGENFLFRNVGGGRFEETGVIAGVAYNGMGDSTASMAAEAADYDADGRYDLFVSDNSFSSLYRNEGGGLFVDHVSQAGVAAASAQFVGWGAFFFDFDNDADLDLFKANSDLSRLFGQEDQLLENDGTGAFTDVSATLGPYFKQQRLGRGAAYADMDDDGDLDVFVVNLDGPAALLRNDGPRRHWLKVQLAGTRGGTDALGARVIVEAAGRRQHAYRRSASGYLSQNDPRLHFGLGDVRRVDSVEVRWPSGRTETRRHVDVDQVLLFQEPPS